MGYPRFRAMDLVVASGVVEGGCKNIIARRLKQDSKRWTVNGANTIIVPRCAIESNRFDDFWERRAPAVARMLTIEAYTPYTSVVCVYMSTRVSIN